MIIKINKTKIWISFMIFFSIVPASIPGLGIGILQLIYVGSLFYLILSLRHQLLTYFSAPLACWLVILIWGAVSILWCKYPTSAMHNTLYNFYFCTNILLTSTVAKNKNLQLYGIKVYLSVGIILALLGFYESFTGNIFNVTYEYYRNYKNFLGFSAPNTIFVNINDHAVFMTICFMLSYLVSESSKYKGLLRIGSLFLFCGNVLMVNSRGSLLAVLTFLFVYYLISTDLSKKILYTLIALLGVIFFYAAISRLMSQTILKEGMDLGRMWIWEESLYNLKNSHFIGVGAGNTSLVNYIVGWREEKISIHNFALEIFCDYGIVGLSALIVWYVSMVKTSVQKLRTNLSLYSGIIAILTAFVPLSLVTSSLVGKYWFYSFISLIIVLTYFWTKQVKTDTNNRYNKK